ncbi:MAG: hypothetical protein ACRCWR_02720, partial [Saezia sp.]
NNHDLRSLNISSLRDEVIILLGNNKPNKELTAQIIDRMAERGYSVSVVNNQIAELTQTDTPAPTSELVNDKIAEITQHEQTKSVELEQLAKEILSPPEMPNIKDSEITLTSAQVDGLSDKAERTTETYERAMAQQESQPNKNDRQKDFDELTR